MSPLNAASTTAAATADIAHVSGGDKGILVVVLLVTPGLMLATTLILGRALGPVEALVSIWKNLVEARAAWLRLDKLLAVGADKAREASAPTLAAMYERMGFARP